MSKRNKEFQWISNSLDGKKIPFTDLGTWQLTHKISEKTCQKYYPYPFESVTVFVCEKVDGKDAGHRAIMKIRTEYVNACRKDDDGSTDPDRIPGTQYPHPNPRKRGPISKDVNEVTISEVERLEQLTEAGCSSTPRLLGYQRLTQNDSMWLPDGYLVCILMELVPGASLENFWELPRSERDQARKAFRVALE